jgi:hypothetical protein
MRSVLVVVAAFAFVALLLGWSRWLSGRRWAAAGHLLLAGLAAAFVAGGWQCTRYLATYEPRIAGFPVVELFFERTGAGRYRVCLTRLPAGRMQVVELVGDQWRLDLQSLDWSAPMLSLGFEPRYRIEALASQPAPPVQPGTPSGVAHDLAEDDAAPPWLVRLAGTTRTPLVRTAELSGGWQPMADGARFDVRLLRGVEVSVDPLNAAASDSLADR